MTLPMCVFRGRVPTAEKCYCRLSTPARLIHSQLCFTCQHAGPVDTTLLPICSRLVEDVPACVHRGDLVRTEQINLCCGAESLPIFSCDLHGECTEERKSPKWLACTECPDAISPEAAALPPLSGPMGLAWFVWPRTETRELWLSQQEIIRAAFDQFDGPKRLYIATSDTSEGEIDPSGWDEIKVAPNDPAGREVPGWRWLLESAANDPGATVWLHAKGTYRGCHELHMQRWWELAYQTMLDVPRVRTALDHAVIAGVFRRTEPAANLGVPWHFSGTFYAVRNDAIKFPPSKAGGWYAEAWPALIADHSTAACIAWDGCADLYQSKNWKEQPV